MISTSVDRFSFDLQDGTAPESAADVAEAEESSAVEEEDEHPKCVWKDKTWKILQRVV